MSIEDYSIEAVLAVAIFGFLWMNHRYHSANEPKPKPKQVRIVNTNIPDWPKYLWLDLVEFLPYEPSNYVWTPGWIADHPDYKLHDDGEMPGFFIEEDGKVFYQDGGSMSDTLVGYCPSFECYSEMVEISMLSDEDLLNDANLVSRIYERWGLVALINHIALKHGEPA